jgi:hypothetical protein
METVENVVGSNVVLFWLDEHICRDNNCTDLRREFESNTTNIYLFHNVEQCRRFLPSVRRKKVFCIIQGKHAQDIVPDIIRFTTEPVVYIFCHYMLTLTEWAQDIRCVLEGGIFNHEKDLLGKLTTDLADYANLKAQEYRIKRAACEEWAENLTNNAKRLRTEKCTLLFKIDPFDNKETPCEEPQ